MSIQDIEVLPVISKKRGKRRKLSNDEIKKALNLSLKGVGPTDIAQVIGVTSRCVHDILDRHRSMIESVPELLEVNSYANLRTDLFSAAELKTLRSMMDADKHAKASLGQVATAFKTLHTARRLEENLSTENVAKTIKYIDLDEDI